MDFYTILGLQRQQLHTVNSWMLLTYLLSTDSFGANSLFFPLMKLRSWIACFLLSLSLFLPSFLLSFFLSRFFWERPMLCRFYALTLVTFRMQSAGCSALRFFLGLGKPRSYRRGVISGARRHFERKICHFVVLMNALLLGSLGCCDGMQSK